MKSTGIVRKVDELGRIVLPKELRRVLEINEKDPIEIYVEEDKIVLKKYLPFGQCAVTGEVLKENEKFAGVMLSPQGKAELLSALTNGK
ncbi:AbrB/MazE/SpoVT family DNA-binding domain-containing protein [Solibacillus isronensis]|uniref:AbrB/MazE/SpoVT family DNA-binding domain-containing protein n=1 Tax=Solibacillus isronensis TaxID=412383 RepID=UPI0039A302F6